MAGKGQPRLGMAGKSCAEDMSSPADGDEDNGDTEEPLAQECGRKALKSNGRMPHKGLLGLTDTDNIGGKTSVYVSLM